MASKKVKLGNIASISTGLVVRRKQANKTQKVVKTYKILTLKSFEVGGWLNVDELEVFHSTEDLDDKYLTREGDVIVRLSNPNTAITIDSVNEGYVVPSLFVVIRLETQELLAGYLGILLNSESTKKLYAKSSVGSTIQTIKTSFFKDVVINIKSKVSQIQAIEINELIEQECMLLEKLIEQKKLYHKGIIQEFMK